MASINELKEVLKETLEERGVLSQIRARIRAEIFSTLNDSPPNRPDLSNENLIINELIREYLAFNGYQHTLSVFLPESGQPQSPPFDRSYITKQLKVV
jgi:lisH domain-containing protein FOPNL